MAFNSKIGWTHHTLNLWHGCTEVHEGCDNCYAATLSHRWGHDVWGNDKPRRMIMSCWKDLAQMQALAGKAGEVHTVFIGSMMDIFEKPMPLVMNDGTKPNMDTGHLRSFLFERIDRGEFPNLLFLFLTKRPSNINKMIPDSWKTSPPNNVMFGTSPVNQKTANTLIPQLKKVNGYRFLSIEPMIGPVDLTDRHEITKGKGEHEAKWQEQLIDGIDWVICGGESGNKKTVRPMHPGWVRTIRNQCEDHKVPFFFKQWGEYSPGPNTDRYTEEKPLLHVKMNGEISWWAGDMGTRHTINHSDNYERGDYPIERVGKNKSGNLLDGKLWEQLPKIPILNYGK